MRKPVGRDAGGEDNGLATHGPSVARDVFCTWNVRLPVLVGLEAGFAMDGREVGDQVHRPADKICRDRLPHVERTEAAAGIPQRLLQSGSVAGLIQRLKVAEQDLGVRVGFQEVTSIMGTDETGATEENDVHGYKLAFQH